MVPLARKLGIKPGGRVLVVGNEAAPVDLIAPLPDGASLTQTPHAGELYDVIVLFAPDYATLAAWFVRLIQHMTQAGGLWVAYYKKSAGVSTDLEFALVQQHGLDAGLVDNKVCAIDEQWTGLRFVIRKRDRR